MKLATSMRRYHWFLVLGGVMLLLPVLVPLVFDRSPSPPPGMNTAGPWHGLRTGQIRLLTDSSGRVLPPMERRLRQEIFDAVLTQIAAADEVLLADFFLWNDWPGLDGSANPRSLARELADALIAQREKHPEMTMLVLTDPINHGYGGPLPGIFQNLVEAGIPVVFTDLHLLPDANRFYTPLARFYSRWLFGERVGAFGSKETPPGRWPNPFQPSESGWRFPQWTELLRLQANHRKVLVSRSKEKGWQVWTGSFNPADSSHAHGNTAIQARGPVALDALKAELDVVEWSLKRPFNVAEQYLGQATAAVLDLRERISNELTPPLTEVGLGRARWLTDKAIGDEIVRLLGSARSGDQIEIAMFYLSDRRVLRAVETAVDQGATLRIILDANRDAFGRVKNGIPNRVTARRLQLYSDQIEVRWAETAGEQFHHKVLSIHNLESSKFQFLTGSANFTRRNLGGINLEAGILVEGDRVLLGQWLEHFDTWWYSQEELRHSLPYQVQAEGWGRLWWMIPLYRWQEWSGMGTF